MPSSLSITWLGHSTFIIGLPSGKRILTDPWLGNPTCPAAFAKPESLKPIDLILMSHGHGDHRRDVVAVARATGAPVACVYELGVYLTDKGLTTVRDMGIGGTQEIAGVSVTMTQAIHSGSIDDGWPVVYSGGATGFVLRAPDMPTIYFAGDTGLFGDMKMIAEVYTPEIAFLPIGDLYTMGPDTAAIAARWLGVRQVVPMHWGTFPVLTGTPETLKAHLKGSGIDVLALTPGETAQ
ncbi:MAG TPA: metal-dependent hydrolase [Vicinamibacterales bacterium]|nr:metal-dependent hydrolase [Vicinamibacterales bacterium]